MIRAIRTGLLCVVLATSLVAGSTGVAGARGSAKVAPRAWARDICVAIDTWGGALDRALGAVEVDVASAPAAVKTALTKLFKNLQRRTKTLTRGLVGAGIPDVKGGAKIAAALQDDLALVSDAVAQARADLSNASTDDAAAFTAAAAATYASVTAAFDAVPAAFDDQGEVLSSPKLQKALQATRACRTLVNQ